MTEPFFFPRPMGLTLGEIAALTGAEPQAGAELDRRITNIAPLDRAGPRDITFLDNVKFSQQLAATQAGACLMGAKLSAKAPARTAALSCPEPYQAFVAVARALFPSALRPSSLFDADGIMPGASVHPTARMEADVKIDPAAIVGPRAEIGSGTVIGAGTVIGPGVRVGRDCAIGGNATISNALIGDRVIIHPGCQIGQDGFGYVMRPGGHLKVPQLGRVIIQNEVEIGANSTVDRGAIRDTIIGEGTKIDNLVQVGHNVSIGRHCVIIAQSGISGSSTLEDHVVLGARVGVGNQFTIGEGAQLAALSVVASDVPAGARWGGFPAKPVQLWIRETKALERMAVRNYGVNRADLKGRPAQKDD